MIGQYLSNTNEKSISQKNLELNKAWMWLDKKLFYKNYPLKP